MAILPIEGAFFAYNVLFRRHVIITRSLNIFRNFVRLFVAANAAKNHCVVLLLRVATIGIDRLNMSAGALVVNFWIYKLSDDRFFLPRRAVDGQAGADRLLRK